jgi:hypothetical protein
MGKVNDAKSHHPWNKEYLVGKIVDPRGKAMGELIEKVE